jgi:hypothetical protein
MKPLNILLSITLLTFVLLSCEKEERNTSTRGADKIDVYIDRNSIPLDFSFIVDASDNPLAPTSGFTNQFMIQAWDSSNNAFSFSFNPTTINPFTFITPTSETLNGAITQRIQIQGYNFDDTQPNSITFNYTAFGPNNGDAIKIDFNGTYYVTGSNIPHTISCIIDINRD